MTLGEAIIAGEDFCLSIEAAVDGDRKAGARVVTEEYCIASCPAVVMAWLCSESARLLWE
jgi:hypothetical protein